MVNKGTVWFVGPELLTGCLNMVPIGVPGCVAGELARYHVLNSVLSWVLGSNDIVVPPQ